MSAEQDPAVAGGRAEAVFRQLAGDAAQPPWEQLADLAPVLGEQVAWSLGTVLARPELDLATRELVTVGMLAALGGREPQLEFHLRGALAVGVGVPRLVEALTQVAVYAGLPAALNAVAVLRSVLAQPSEVGTQ